MAKWIFLSIPLIWGAGCLIVVDIPRYLVLSALILGLLVLVALVCVWRAPATRSAIRDAWGRIFD